MPARDLPKRHIHYQPWLRLTFLAHGLTGGPNIHRGTRTKRGTIIVQAVVPRPCSESFFIYPTEMLAVFEPKVRLLQVVR